MTEWRPTSRLHRTPRMLPGTSVVDKAAWGGDSEAQAGYRDELAMTVPNRAANAGVPLRGSPLLARRGPIVGGERDEKEKFFDHGLRGLPDVFIRAIRVIRGSDFRCLVRLEFLRYGSPVA